jgi:DnaK suppressor protein
MSTTDSPNSAEDSSSADVPASSADELATRLRLELERAVANAHRMQSELDELLVDPGVIQEDRDAAARSLEHARREVELARSAVDRLDSGIYDKCATCGGDIGEERLAAVAGVTTCVRCADS